MSGTQLKNEMLNFLFFFKKKKKRYITEALSLSNVFFMAVVLFTVALESSFSSSCQVKINFKNK